MADLPRCRSCGEQLRFHSGANHRPFVGCDKCEIAIPPDDAAPWLASQLMLARSECRAWRKMRDDGLIALPESGCCDLILAVAANQMENT